MNIEVDNDLQLTLIDETHAAEIFHMVDANRNHLRPWLPFVDKMQHVSFAEAFVAGTLQRNQLGQEFAFIIYESSKAVGRIGIYKLDQQHKTGEIGYWLIQEASSKGIATRACKALLDFCFHSLALNRIEIRCSTQNHRSRLIPERLGFTHEGILRQAEYLYNTYTDLHLFALLREEYQP